MLTNTRRYRLAVIEPLLVSMVVVLVLTWVLLLTERAALLFIAIGAIGSGFAVWHGICAWRSGGVQESDEGVSNRGIVTARAWTWDEIDKFVSVRRRTFLVTRERQPFLLTGVADGRRVLWDGGETREITALLNQRLEYRRSLHTSSAKAPTQQEGANRNDPPAR